jgi:hypothetical protein
MKCLIVATLFLVYGSSAGAEAKTWDGFVTDTHCGTNCQRTSSMTPDRACVRRCVRRGSQYGLWFGNQVYVLEPQQRAAKFAAERVEVTGEMTDGTIHIQSIHSVLGQK